MKQDDNKPPRTPLWSGRPTTNDSVGVGCVRCRGIQKLLAECNLAADMPVCDDCHSGSIEPGNNSH